MMHLMLKWSDENKKWPSSVVHSLEIIVQNLYIVWNFSIIQVQDWAQDLSPI